uniref:DUF1279 domain-containing protein n=1 Tax=Kalanchoe fedtschenkoi TaxID=63787 RepID=A0A7N0UDU0_KALFE
MKRHRKLSYQPQGRTSNIWVDTEEWSCSIYMGSQEMGTNSQLTGLGHWFKVRAVKAKADQSASSPSPAPEEVTEKFGLEAGLWKELKILSVHVIFSSRDEGIEGSGNSKSKGDQAKELLAKYGGVYLATSITLSLISFSLCFVLINAGVDVQSLLMKVGISVDETGEKVGTFALAYAAHKAGSPIRFPPTVALTPVVAGWIGKMKRQK